MAGRHKFSELRARMSPESQARADEKSAKLEMEMNLSELRRAMQLSQEEIAAILHVGQGSVAKMEKRADMLVGTLRRFIQAMGGDLELIARFPNHSVKIENFSSLSKPANEVEPSNAHQAAS
ncbi:XRE family transcriptional regulator [Sneathiella sp.]|uniref:XRE family transcriptional regulator n=1 Tax=Sneathiella sp. TaxID=1964365 RepID=UPI0026178439|nr:XRE family transcriptional regulator [Sneathiella sp.]MDF2366446.1 XRE family transcriptional regulator [Sneathiella sp.]